MRKSAFERSAPESRGDPSARAGSRGVGNFVPWGGARRKFRRVVSGVTIVNAYSSNHELLASSPDMSTTKRLVLHGVDAVGLVHALLLRIQALVLPIQSLVFSGH